MTEDLFFQAANARALGSERMPRVWSVSQVNAVARQMLEGSLPPLWVAGEVSGFKRYPAGHCFFTLKDRRAQLSCVMWRDQARGLPTEPPEGMAVHVFGYASLYERAGRFQFVVRELTARGAGLWRLAFERLREKLEAEGLMDPERKRPLPEYPSCVGLVTSIEGAALRDIVTIIRRRAPWTDVLVYAARVQGAEAPGSIVAAIGAACRSRRADVLIVGRGGGSIEDLRAFNDEAVARAVAGSAIPVVSAIGHEADVTLADLVADRRASTPSAAAELVVPDREQLRVSIGQTRRRLTAGVRSGLDAAQARVERLEKRAARALGAAIERRRAAIEGLRQRLQALGPMTVLQRGYGLALDDDDRILRSVTDIAPGMEFTLRLKDGRVRSRALESHEE